MTSSYPQTVHTFAVSALTIALSTAMAASYAAEINVANGNTYTQNIEATDATTSLKVENGGVVENQKIVIKGGTLNLAEGSLVKTDYLDVLVHQSLGNKPGGFNGRIEASTFIFRGATGSAYGAPINGTIKADVLQILNDRNVQVGPLFSNSETLKEVKKIHVLAVNGGRTGIQTSGEQFRVDSEVLVESQGTSEDARLEVVDGHTSYANVTIKGNKAILQPNNGAALSIDNLTVMEGASTNLQTWKDKANTATNSDFTLGKVTLEKNATLQASIYDDNPGATIKGKDIVVNMAGGSQVDFGGHTKPNWKSENIKISADSLTFNVADVDSGSKIYLTGKEGNITTKKENIRVVAAGANNTGNAQADLDKLSDLVKYNTNANNQHQLTDAVGLTVRQEASDIFDAASGTIGKDGGIQNVVTEANANIHGIAEMTAVGLHIWRNEINDMNKRLGELRDSSAEANGVWARVYNGKAKFGKQAITNKYTAFQFGYDRQVMPGTWVGGAFSWTDGSNDFVVGGGDSSLLAFTGYGSKLWDNGLFIDVTGKIGRIKNDFDIDLATGHSSASYHTNAVSVSAEADWRFFPMQNSFFVEPQVEVMYGHVADADYTTSTGVKVNQASAETLIGRAGVVLGLKCPDNRGNAYLRASVLHDWKGDADFTFTKDGKYRRALSEALGGTWFEYGIGANFNATKQVHVYADVEAANGGEVDTDYRLNLGVRYAF